MRSKIKNWASSQYKALRALYVDEAIKLRFDFFLIDVLLTTSPTTHHPSIQYSSTAVRVFYYG
jgi:hypothetical protein